MYKSKMCGSDLTGGKNVMRESSSLCPYFLALEK
jgi:hypothetical protein